MPLFSVVIPTYNRYSTVKRAINSVLDQSFRDFELIIIDDGSTDNTSALEEEYRGRLTFYRQENRGVSSARNLGIKKSSSGFLTFLDSDDHWLPEKLQFHKQFIEAGNNIKIHQSEEIWIRNGRRVNPRYKHKKSSGNIFLQSLGLCLISPSAVCLDADLIENYGAFDENLPACEDYDLWLRITSGESAGLINTPLVMKYGGHRDQLSKKYWGMDRFRIYSIIKLLETSANDISSEYVTAANEAAVKKTDIMLQGALNRGNRDFVEKLKIVKKNISNGNYNSRCFLSLLEI